MKRLSLLGKYVEAYLYFDFLWLFSEDGTIRAFDLASFCTERLNGDGEAAIALFSDNRLLSQLGPTQNRARELLSEGGAYEVSSEDVDRYSYICEKELDFRSLLDVRFYYGRAYVGTDSNILQVSAMGRSDMQEFARGRSLSRPLERRIVSDRPARAFHCRFGAVGAACGLYGGLIGLGADAPDGRWTINFGQFAESSFGLTISGRAITNLAGRNRIQFYSTVSAEDRREKTEEHLDESVMDGNLHLGDVAGIAFQSEAEQLNSIMAADVTRGVFLFNRSLWQFKLNGPPTLARFMDSDLAAPHVRVHPIRRGPPGRVLSMSSIEAGVLAETDDSVFLYQAGSWFPLVEEAVHAVRGYQTSKRYQRIATAVTRDRVDVIAV
ncbi:hypothetical protein [Bradyrhizobium oligotrophicum]|uniref:hypothetical protein n=1 Tax=Bradyrhizobium oligotrophicum TaxID=44255 RepID=UPI003EBC849B